MAKVIPAVGVIVDRKKGKIHIIQNSKNTTLKNIQQGFYDQYGFHPIRASNDYDSDRLSDDTEGGYGRRKRKKATTKRKPAAKKRKKATTKKKRR